MLWRNGLGIGFILANACVEPATSTLDDGISEDSTFSSTEGNDDEDGTVGTLGSESTGSSTSTSGIDDTDVTSDSDTGTDTDYHELFDPTQLATFEITIGTDSWNALMQAGPGSKTYEHASIRYKNIVFEDVGIRLKGRGSFENLDGKPSFKIRFDKFISNQSLLGLQRLTLNNMVQDPSFAHERMAYSVMRQLGLKSPLCNSAQVFVNGEYFGLYANVQSLDKVFVADNFSKTIGNLYDTTNEVYFSDLDRSLEREQAGSEQELRFELETNTKLSDTRDLSLAIDTNFNNDQEEGWWGEPLNSILDVDQFLRAAAAQALIADWDGFFGARNNYKLYHNPINDRFSILSWGLDQTFGMRESDYYDLHYCYDGRHSQRFNSLFFERCKTEDTCWERYRSAVSKSLEQWNTLNLQQQINAIEDQIESSVEQDVRSPYTLDHFRTAIGNLRDFVEKRGAIVKRQLESGCVD